MGRQPLAKPDFSLLEGATVYQPIREGIQIEQSEDEYVIQIATDIPYAGTPIRERRQSPSWGVTAQEAADALIQVFGGREDSAVWNRALLQESTRPVVTFDEAYKHTLMANPFTYFGTQVTNWFVDVLANVIHFFKPTHEYGGRSNRATLALMQTIDREIAQRQVSEPRLAQYEDAIVGYENC